MLTVGVPGAGAVARDRATSSRRIVDRVLRASATRERSLLAPPHEAVAAR